MSPETKNISFEDFTEVTLKSVLRAMEVRSKSQRFPVGPIIFGLIWYPEVLTGSVGEVLQQQSLSKETLKK